MLGDFALAALGNQISDSRFSAEGVNQNNFLSKIQNCKQNSDGRLPLRVGT